MRQEEVSTGISGKRKKETEKLNVGSTKGGTAFANYSASPNGFCLAASPSVHVVVRWQTQPHPPTQPHLLAGCLAS